MKFDHSKLRKFVNNKYFPCVFLPIGVGTVFYTATVRITVVN